MNLEELRQRHGHRCQLPITIGDGWADIVNDAIDAMIEVDPNVAFSQIKEKFGHLRMMYKSAIEDDRLMSIADNAGAIAGVTCDVCGTREGVTVVCRDYWVRIRCVPHQDTR